MQTYLVENDQKEQLAHDLASKNQGILSGVDFRSFSSYFQTQEGLSGNILLYEIYLLLKKQNKEDFPIYAKMFQYPSFIKELSIFASDCIKYKINPDTLPDSSPRLSELKSLVRLILTMDLKTYHQVKKEEEALHKLANTNLIIGPFFPADQYEQELFKQLKMESIHFYETHKPSTTIYFRHALSLRQELDGALFDILKKGQPCNIILCDYEKQFPFLAILLDRYGLSYNCLAQNKRLKNAAIFEALVQFALEPNMDHFQEALSISAFGKKTPVDLFEFFQTTMVEVGEFFDYSLFQTEEFKNDFAHRQELSEKAKQFYAEISDDIDLLVQEGSIQEKVQHAYTVFRKVALVNDVKEIRLSQSIKEDLEGCMEKMETKEDVEYFLECIKQASTSLNNFANGPITITDLSHPVLHQPTTYVLGCSGKSYPNVPVLKGLFDETYVKEIDAYPSLKTRHTTYMNALNWILESGDTIYYSYYTNDYQGKELMLASELEQLYSDIATTKKIQDLRKPWPLVKLQRFKKGAPVLTQEEAEALFFDENKHLTSSISRIERYFQCPYSYFVESGLKIREAFTTDLNAATLGTIQHAVLEELMKRYGKQYASLGGKDIDALLLPYFNDLNRLFPKMETELFFSRLRLVQSLQDALFILKEYEDHTVFTCKEVEWKFLYDMNEQLTIQGIVDRIDGFNKDFLIIDYKSSEKELVDKDVRLGKQLQLLTYLIAVKELFDLDPVGCYYYSLKPSESSLEAYHVKKAGGYQELEQTNESYQKYLLDTRRFKGWSFKENDMDNATFKTFFKPGSRGKKSFFDYPLIKDCMDSLYEYFLNQIKQGRISIRPQDGACTFCPYKSLCRFTGLQEDTDPIYTNVEKSLKGETL